MKFDLNKQIVVESNIFNYVTKEVFSQFDFINILRPVSYFSKKYTLIKYNYKIYNKKFMAIIPYFES